MRGRLVAIVVLVLWGLITHGTHAGTGDEPHYLAIAHSIGFDGDLDLSNNYGANEPLVGGGVLRPEAHVRPGVDDVLRPVHDIGLPLAFAPYVRLAVPVTHALTRIVPPRLMRRARLNPAVLYRHLISMAMIGLAAVLAAMMFETFAALGATQGAALATTLLLALSPPLLIFSVLLFTELLSALLCFLVFRQIVLGEIHGALRWWGVGCATGFLFLIHARNIGVIVPLAVLALYALRAPERRRHAMAFGAGLTLMFAVRTLVNYHFWGKLLSGPHARFTTQADLSAIPGEMVTRLAGLLVDQEFGLLPYAPVYVLAAVGAFTMFRARRDLAIAVLGVTVSYVALILFPLTNVHGWTGGWNPAARFLTPIVPLLGLLVFAGLRSAPRPLVFAIVALQIGISAYSWQNPKVLWNDGDGRAAVCDQIGRACNYLPSLASRVQGVTGSGVHGFTGSPVHGFRGSRVHGFTGSPVHGFTGSRVHWFRGSGVQGFTGSPVHRFADRAACSSSHFFSGAKYSAIALASIWR
jgi:hypothetical protein